MPYVKLISYESLKIYREIGDRAGESRCYSNQAKILIKWGKLEEAMALEQKEEQIKTELGDRTGLAICWWNQGALHGKLGDKKKQIILWQKSIDMNNSLVSRLKSMKSCSQNCRANYQFALHRIRR